MSHLTEKERAARRAAFQKMGLADKAEYIFAYYKLPIILGLVALYLLSSAAYRQLTKREVLVYPAIANISIGDDLTFQLSEGFVSAIGANPRKAEVSLYSGLYLADDPSPENHQYAYASNLKIMAAMESKELDVVLMNKEAYDLLSQRGYLLDLRGLFSQDDSLYQLLEPHLTENTVILEDNAIEYTLGEAQQYRAVTEKVINGLDVSRFPLFQEAGFADSVYLGVIGNSPRLAAVLQYIAYLTGGQTQR